MQKEKSRLPLATRYRPRTWEDVAGQANVVSRLRGMLNSGSIPNALMFKGPSGVGKTTLARVFARYINCEDGTSCGKCASCIALDKDKHPDYIEMNCAVTRGIDDVRGMLQQINFVPQMGNMRIISLDECFPPGTSVRLASGQYKAIEDVEIGDVVISYDTDSGQMRTNEVTHTMMKSIESREMVRVNLEGGASQECTGNHKWWSVTRNRYVRADELLEGEELLVADQY